MELAIAAGEEQWPELGVPVRLRKALSKLDGFTSGKGAQRRASDAFPLSIRSNRFPERL